MENLGAIANEFQLSDIVARAMINRGMDTVPKVRAFLNNDLSLLNAPYLLKGMETAVDKIFEAIGRKNKICVYGDYDVDGITSTAVMIRTLRKLGADAVYYIPNRIEEGYGLNAVSMDRIKELGINLIITVDCGIRSNDVVEYARSLGMEVVITDHHECEGELPKAHSILNPHQPDCGYPFKDLAGVGVAFKLSSALLSKADNASCAEELLDIVSLGTIADIVPLLGENRIIVKHGLNRMGNTDNKGIKALLRVCGLYRRELTTYNVAFMLAPRINAAGRIANATECVELLLTDNEDRAMEIAAKLNSDNLERQAIENRILNDAIAIIEGTSDLDKDKVLVLCDKDWHIGVIGIVASRLAERFYLPTFIMSREGELCKGSARSIPGFNIFEAMSKYDFLFKRYGGHEMAAGFTIHADRVGELRECMNRETERVFGIDKLIPEILVDYRLEPGDITLETVRQLRLMEPFGTGNPSPVFVYRGLSVRSFRAVGNGEKHLSLIVNDGINNVKCIAYNLGKLQNILSIGRKIDIICSVENNIWNGIESVQLNIRDIRLTE